MTKEILCGFGVDGDAVAGWLGSYGGEDSPDDISRGIFAGEVGDADRVSRLVFVARDLEPDEILRRFATGEPLCITPPAGAT
jgi:hypothetical protein